jgi:hypothetical protein
MDVSVFPRDVPVLTGATYAGEENLYYGDLPTRPVSTSLQNHPELSRSVPGIPAAAAAASSGPAPQAANKQGQGRAWGGLR